MIFITKHRKKHRNQKDRKIILFTHGTFLGIPVTLFFIIVDIAAQKWLELVIDSVILSVLVLTTFFLIRTNNSNRIIRIAFFPFSIALLAIIAIGSGGSTSFYWTFLIPLFYAYFLGIKEGLHWISIYFVLLMAILFIPDLPGVYSYHLYFSYRFIIAFILVSIITFALEFARLANEKSLKKSYILIKQSEYKRERLFDLANDSIFIIDPETQRILDCNKNACDTLEYTKSELLKLTVPDLDIGGKSNVQDYINQITKENGVRHESAHKTKSGNMIDVEISSNLIEMGEERFIQSFVRDISDRKQIEAEKEETILKLQNALDEIKILQGILPICSYCKKIRDDNGYWNQVEIYISRHSGALFSHSICPECGEKHFPELHEMRNRD